MPAEGPRQRQSLKPFEKAEHLEPNFGYLKFNEFADPDICAGTAIAILVALLDLASAGGLSRYVSIRPFAAPRLNQIAVWLALLVLPAAALLELRVQEQGPPVVQDLEALTRRQRFDRLEDADHRERRLEASDIEPASGAEGRRQCLRKERGRRPIRAPRRWVRRSRLAIEPHAPVIRGAGFGPVGEAPAREDPVERHRLEGRPQDQHAVGP
jgi:hypothetical protein